MIKISYYERFNLNIFMNVQVDMRRIDNYRNTQVVKFSRPELKQQICRIKLNIRFQNGY